MILFSINALAIAIWTTPSFRIKLYESTGKIETKRKVAVADEFNFVSETDLLTILNRA